MWNYLPEGRRAEYAASDAEAAAWVRALSEGRETDARRPPVVSDPRHQQLSAEHVETRPMLGHESLLTVWSVNTPNRDVRLSAVNNVCGKYN